MATKAQQIIARFTTDPVLTAKILGIVSGIKSKKLANIDSVIAQFTSDPALAATIKTTVSKVSAGQNLQSVPGTVRPDLANVASVGRTVQTHTAAIRQILAS